MSKSYDPRAKEALDRWLEIEARGGTPEAWWSQHNGYRVVDSVEWAVLQRQLNKEIYGC
jgi:hypothetical protein